MLISIETRSTGLRTYLLVGPSPGRAPMRLPCPACAVFDLQQDADGRLIVGIVGASGAATQSDSETA